VILSDVRINEINKIKQILIIIMHRFTGKIACNTSGTRREVLSHILSNTIGTCCGFDEWVIVTNKK
jgi:hypothetical protein